MKYYETFHWDKENEENNCLLTKDEFIAAVECGAFTDDDGSGYPIDENDEIIDNRIWPSNYKDLSELVKKVLWFNK